MAENHNEASSYLIDRWSWLVGGIGIAALSVLAYSLAFTYEAGFACYFDIPLSLIHLDLITVFYAIGFILLAVLFTLMVTNALWPIIYKQKDIIRWKLYFLSPFIGAFFALAFLYGNCIEAFTAILFVVFLLTEPIIQLVIAYFTPRRGRTYSEILEANEHHESLKPQKSLLYHLSSRWGIRHLLRIGLLILLLFLLAFHVGRSEAYRQDKFLTVENSQRVVLRIYPDRFICTSWDEKTKMVGRDLSILDNATVAQFTFERRVLGPLKPSK